jgi:hypothetical protein
METIIRIKTSWEGDCSDYVLEQKITIEGDSLEDFIGELKKELFKDYPIGITIHRDYFVDSFSNPELFSQFYDELVLCLCQIDYFDLTIDDDLKSYLNQNQLKHHETGNDYDYGGDIYESRFPEKK